jgi:hypothetical protein
MTTVAIAASAAGVGFAAPGWTRGDQVATTVTLDGSLRSAEQWLVENLSHRQRLIVGDEVWIYLVEHGFDSQPVKAGFYSRTLVTMWQLDRDPAVQAYFPLRWREFDYIVSTQAMRDNIYDNPSTAQALQHSRVVASFGGQDDQLVQIRRITPAGG